MQVLAVGRKFNEFDRWMQINGFIAWKPIVGGLEQEVTKNRNDAFCYGVNYDRTDHKSITVWLF